MATQEDIPEEKEDIDLIKAELLHVKDENKILQSIIEAKTKENQ
jgi:hypothetical protein